MALNALGRVNQILDCFTAKLLEHAIPAFKSHLAIAFLDGPQAFNEVGVVV